MNPKNDFVEAGAAWTGGGTSTVGVRAGVTDPGGKAMIGVVGVSGEEGDGEMTTGSISLIWAGGGAVGGAEA